MWALDTEHVQAHFSARGKFRKFRNFVSLSLALLYGIFIRISSASTRTNTLTHCLSCTKTSQTKVKLCSSSKLKNEKAGKNLIATKSVTHHLLVKLTIGKRNSARHQFCRNNHCSVSLDKIEMFLSAKSHQKKLLQPAVKCL